MNALRTIGHYLGRALLFVLIAFCGVWIGFSLWYKLPFPVLGRDLAVIGWAVFVLAVLVLQFTRARWKACLAFLVAILAFAAWWSTIRPHGNLDWTPDVEHIVTGVRQGDIVTLENVRNFDWQSLTEFTPRWETRSYDLSKIRTVDLFLSYWSSPAIAHVLVSFGFEGGGHVVFSAETRKQKGQEYSSIAGFFRYFELALLAADERDIIRLRTNVRGEDVYRYPLGMPQAGMRELFLSYVEMGNGLAGAPEFYNTITTNCTTVVFRLLRLLDPALPFDYRVLLSGYLPSYIFANQGYKTGLSFEAFRRRAAVSAFGKAAGDDADFSAAIRPASGLVAP
jgi:hypothetical protein